MKISTEPTILNGIRENPVAKDMVYSFENSSRKKEGKQKKRMIGLIFCGVAAVTAAIVAAT